jgi:hypothetical protein
MYTLVILYMNVNIDLSSVAISDTSLCLHKPSTAL